ncbi:MAG: DUF3530 family protein [Motiliproteus sp.]
MTNLISTIITNRLKCRSLLAISSSLLPTLLLSVVATLALHTVAVQAADEPVSAAESNSGSDPRILPDLEQERLQALADSQLPDTDILWLETQHESFLGLFQPANAAAPKGAVLLLHHDRTSADWPGAITTLRHGLPDQGWHTLSLALPDEPEYIPPRLVDIELSGRDKIASTASASVASPPPQPVADTDTDSDKLAEHFDQISARIDAGLAHLTQLQPEKLLIVGQGSGGYWALRYTVDKDQQPLLFPVLIDTVPPVTPTEPPLIELIEKLQRPTLDLYHGNGLKQQRIEVLALQRLNAAKRKGHQLLTSSRMPSRAGDWRQPDKRLLGVARGMLEKLVEPSPMQPNVSGVNAAGQQAPR